MVTIHTTLNNFEFLTQVVFMGLVSSQTNYRLTSGMIFVREMRCVFSETGTELLNINFIKVICKLNVGNIAEDITP